LPWRVKVQQKGSESPRPEKATLLRQEWLLQPDFLIHLALPEQPARLAELTERLRERRWHFTPCMGLSELLAEVEFVAWQTGVPLAAGRYPVQCLCLAEQVHLQPAAGIGIQLLRLPQRVSRERVFSHAAYYLEHRGQPFPVETAAAWQVGDWTLLFS
jgi:CRISPR-associated protein Cas5h